MLQEKGAAALKTANQILTELWEIDVYFRKECPHSLRRPGFVIHKKELPNVTVVRKMIRLREKGLFGEPQYENHYSVKMKGIRRRKLSWMYGTDPIDADIQLWRVCMEIVTDWVQRRTMPEQEFIDPC